MGEGKEVGRGERRAGGDVGGKGEGQGGKVRYKGGRGEGAGGIRWGRWPWGGRLGGWGRGEGGI